MDLHAVSCFLILLTCAEGCFGQEVMLPQQLKIKTGNDVEITPLRIPHPTPITFRWFHNGSLIINVFPGGNVTSPGYIGRISVSTITLALELRKLTENDTGQYTLRVETDKESIDGHTSLQVLVPASNATIINTTTVLVEFNDSVSLVCSASGSSLSFIWLNRSSEVIAGERVQLTNNNSSLTITSVMRGDTGPYQCEASNSVSNARSHPLTLTIHYGPENVRVVAAPGGPSYSSGSNLTLTCSAESSPAAEFQWAVNGTELGELGQELRLSNIQNNHSGNYTCMAHNRQTLRYATSEPISITVLEYLPPGGVEGSLSAGAIAGIVIGVLLGVAGIAGLIFYFVKDKKIPKTTSRGNKQDGATPDERQHEMHYAEINHLPSNQGQRGVPAIPRAQAAHVSQHNKTATSNPASQTVYSDVKNL